MGPKKGGRARPAAQAEQKGPEVRRWGDALQPQPVGLRGAAAAAQPPAAAAAAAAAAACSPRQRCPTVQGLAEVAAAYLRFRKSPASLKVLKKAAEAHPSALAELCLAKAALVQGVQAAIKVRASACCRCDAVCSPPASQCDEAVAIRHSCWALRKSRQAVPPPPRFPLQWTPRHLEQLPADAVCVSIAADAHAAPMWLEKLFEGKHNRCRRSFTAACRPRGQMRARQLCWQRPTRRCTMSSLPLWSTAPWLGCDMHWSCWDAH